jgi:hypothetical protein
MEVAGLVVGMAVERLKLETRRAVVRCIESVEEAIENLPDELEKHPCTGNILCQRQGVRHKVGCIGKDLPFDAYAKELGSIE